MKCVQKEGEGRKGSFSGFLFFVSAGWESIKTNFKLFRENRAKMCWESVNMRSIS